ncbi:hypothetical protein U3C50_003350 [Providencia rettgeri]|nr:hypothetical protein [Providencia rettgeri]
MGNHPRVRISPPPPEYDAMLLISMAFLLFGFYGYAIQYAILFWFPSDGIGEYWTPYGVLLLTCHDNLVGTLLKLPSHHT